VWWVLIEKLVVALANALADRMSRSPADVRVICETRPAIRGRPDGTDRERLSPPKAADGSGGGVAAGGRTMVDGTKTLERLRAGA